MGREVKEAGPAGTARTVSAVNGDDGKRWPRFARGSDRRNGQECRRRSVPSQAELPSEAFADPASWLNDGEPKRVW